MHVSRTVGALLLPLLLGAAGLRAESLNPENLRTRCGDQGAEPVCEGPSCQTCQRACHSSHFVNSGLGNLTVEGLPDPFFVEDTAYPLSVVFEDETNPDFVVAGFQLSTLSLQDTDGDTVLELCQGGVLETVSAETRVELDPATTTQWLEHTQPQVPALGTTMWEFLWTAPSAPANVVSFNVCAVAADADGTQAVDWVYCSEFLVRPEFLPCEPMTVEASATAGPGDCEATIEWLAVGEVSPTTWDVSFSADGGPFAPVPGCTGLVDVTTCAHSGAPWGQDIVYRVEGTDSCPLGPRTESDDTDTPVRVEDTTPPGFPAPATTAGSDQCDVTIQWDPTQAADACSGIAGFHIYRSDGANTCPTGNLRGTVPDPGASSYLDTVPADGDYTYWVRAFDAAGWEDDNCVTAPVTVTGCIGQCDDFTLEVTAAPGPGDCQVQVAWTPAGNEGETLYDVLVSRDGAPFEPIAACQDLQDVTQCLHDPAAWGEDLVYRVEATDSCPLGPRDASAVSDPPVRALDGTPPVLDAPGVQLFSTKCDVSIEWAPANATDACSGLAGFRVYRSAGMDDCPTGDLVEDLPDASARSSGETLVAIGEYFYWVRAYDNAGNVDANCETASVFVTKCNVEEPWFWEGGFQKDWSTAGLILDWTDAGADSYNVYRAVLERVQPAVLSTGEYDQVQCRIPGNSWIDFVLEDRVSYFYLVVPVLQDREHGYGCGDTDADTVCDFDRLPASVPCP